jgi:hypothetical protein
MVLLHPSPNPGDPVMNKVLRFNRRRRKSGIFGNYRPKSDFSNTSSPKSSPRKKRSVVAAANVFAILALENPEGLRMLESLGKQMLAATRLLVSGE